MKKLKSFMMMLLLLPCMFIFTACGNNDNPSQNSAYAIVSFNTDGGSVIENVKVKKGEKIQAPANPTKDYFEFICWCYNDKEWSFVDCTIDKNITLKARWKTTIFNVDEKTGTITGLTDYGKTLSSIEIPSTSNGIEIKKIGNNAFEYCSSLTNVTIGNSVTSIGKYAFNGCYKLVEIKNLSNLNIEAGSKDYGYVGCYALRVYKTGEIYLSTDENGFVKYNDGKNIYLVNYVGTETNITIPNDVKIIKDHAFYGCSSLTSITIGNSVTSIGDYTFYKCSALTSVTIPDSVTSIDWNAFYGCSGLTSVIIPNSATSIGNDAFRNCYKLVEIKNLSNLNIVAGSKDYGYVGYYAVRVYNTGESYLSTDENGFVKYNDGENIYLVNYVGTDTNITIPNDVTIIYDYAFYGCSSLKYNEYGNGLYLGNENNKYLVLVEAKSKDIKSCTINNNCKFICSSAFYWCSKITSITIPNSVTSIGSDAFYNCSALTSVNIGNSVKSIGDRAFLGCSALTSITIPDSVTSIGSEAFYWCSSLTSITIPDSVTSIGDGAFGRCSSLTSITIPFVGGSETKNTYLGYIFGASRYTDNSSYVPTLLKEVIITKATSIGDYAFYGCSALKTVDMSVTSIGDYAFYGCSALKTIDMRYRVTSIGDYSFSGCSALKL